MADNVGSAVSEIQDAPETFSSWDKCMEKSYCKYPAIIAIVIGVLIAISIIWCCVRCCCCGLSCCCGCLSCFNGCCPGPRGRKRTKDVDPPASPYPQPNPYVGYVPPSNPQPYNGPNTATFDVPGGPVNGDALPRMPTWKDGRLEEGGLNNLAQSNQTAGVAPASGAWSSRGGYSEIPDDDRVGGQPGQYRGTSTTHPYGSDIGAQSFVSQNPPYQPPMSQPPPGASYQAPGQARPPSLLQVGRRPMNGSMREV